jgi:tRNA/rRNA methyltransferase
MKPANEPTSLVDREADRTPGPPVIILVEPQLGENIGMAARAMANFGLERMRLVTPRDGWPNEAARKPAAGADHIIDAARTFTSLAEAAADLHYILATTARPRDMIKPVITPEMAGENICTKVARGHNCGILFGRESSGLSNNEIAVCHAVVTVPVYPQFSSINIAQAVLLLGYEWFKDSHGGG